MKERKDKYHVPIKPEFLFDKYKKFSNNYTPWVYVSIRHNYEYYLQHAPNKLFDINVNSMAAYYVTTPATIYDAINELVSAGLLEKRKRKYRLFDDSVYVGLSDNAKDDDWNKFPKFVMIHENAYNDLLFSIKREILPMGTNKRLIVKCLKVFYYLMAHNRHCLLNKEQIVKSELSQTSLERKLGIDHKVVKFLLSVLNDKGYIKLEDGKIFTLNKDIYDPDKYSNMKPNYETDFEKEWMGSETKSIVSKKNDSLTSIEAKVPKNFIGYKKSNDGKIISIITHNEKLSTYVLSFHCQGDGIPPTLEEENIADDLFNLGKYSKYYNPKDYWKYKPLKAV